MVVASMAGMEAEIIVHSKGSAGTIDPLNRVYKTMG